MFPVGILELRADAAPHDAADIALGKAPDAPLITGDAKLASTVVHHATICLDGHISICYHVIKTVITVIAETIMVRTQIQLTEEQAKALRKMAAARRLSSAELIRRAIDAMIKSSPAADSEERRKKAIEIAGRFSSGKSDVSRKHDKYLADAFGK